MEDLKGLVGKASNLLAEKTLDKQEYTSLESFVLKNSARLGANPDFRMLVEMLDDVAHKFDIPTIDSLREGFGANSCAQ